MRIVHRITAEALEKRTLLSSSLLVFPGSDGRLIYTPNVNGDVIPDFSQVGYETGIVALPDTAGGIQVPVKVTLNPSTSDMTATIQTAINTVSAMSADANGFRGAILLTAGNYPISGTLNITTSGVVLIGQGNSKSTGTTLEATGTSQRFLINVSGTGSPSTVSNTTHNIQGYVPVGATSFTVDSTTNLQVGSTVIVHRPSTANWIHDIGMDTLTIPWTAGSKDLDSDRVITAINGKTITIDAPLTNSLDPNYGGGTIYKYTWSGRIQQVGVMNLYAYSDYTGSNVGAADTDTTHATGVITMDNVANAWVSNITADNFATNIVEIGDGAKWVTFDQDTLQNTSQAQTNIDDAPAGVGNSGQEILIENTTFLNAYHAIALGANFPGPSVYTNITITDPLEGALGLPHSRDESGPHQRWSTGGLFDNVSNTDWINIRNAGNEGTGHGWQGANYVFWNVNARTDVSSPPTAQNWVIGGTGSTSEGTAIYDQRGSTVFPQSLYQTQLWDRMHPDPTVATTAAASPNPLSGATSVSLSVLGVETGLAESSLSYSWAVTSKPAGAATPTFTVNGTNAAKNTITTLSQTGTYIFVVTISDPGGLLATSTVIITPVAATVISGTSSDDILRIVRNGTFVDVFRNDPINPVLHQDYASSPELVISGLAGNDTITVDYSGGNPVPLAGLVVDGGTGTTDTISILGSSGNDAAILASGGSVSINGGQFGYANFEALNLTLGTGNDTITAGGNASITTSSITLNVTGGGTLAMAASSTLPNFTDLNVSSATFDLNGQSQTIDALNGTGAILDNNATVATFTVGQQNGNGNFSGMLTNGTGNLSVIKAGTGTLTLSGANAYTGNTTITGGVIASGNSASLAGLSGKILFNGGTFHVTADTISANIANKYTTSFTGATSFSTGTFDIDSGVALTIGTPGGSASLQTNGGGSHGGDFTKTGAGTLKILSNNAQQDNVFHLEQGTIDLESASGLGGGDSGVSLSASDGTTLILKQDVATNFLTPINIADAGGMLNVVIDRQTPGAGATDQINALTSSGSFTLNVSTGTNVTSGTAGLSVGSVTLSGDGTFNIGNNAGMAVSGIVSGAFAVTKLGAGLLTLSGANNYSGATNINLGTFTVAVGGSLASANITVAAGSVFNVNGSLATTTILNANGAVTFGANTGSGILVRALAGLNITAVGNVQILSPSSQSNRTVLVTPITFGGKLDLTSNDLILKSNTQATAFAQLKAGFNAGTGYWNGATGILSSSAAGNTRFLTTLGYRSGGNPFDTVSTTAGDVLIKYTYYGDADLSGSIDGADYQQIDLGFGSQTTGWSNGDFNYDGVINGSDFALIDNAFNQLTATGAVALAIVAPVQTKTKMFSAAPIRIEPAFQFDSPMDGLWNKRRRSVALIARDLIGVMR